MKKYLKKIICLAIICMFASAIFFMYNNIAKADSRAYYAHQLMVITIIMVLLTIHGKQLKEHQTLLNLEIKYS